MTHPADHLVDLITDRTDEELIGEFLQRLPLWDETPQDHKEETPARYVRMMKEMTTREPFNFTTFPAPSQDMIILEKIPFYTFCAHHIVPFFGYAYVGYVPDEKMAGLSKFARLVKQTAKGFWTQEELTHEISIGIEQSLQPLGCAVVLRAEHLCMAMRGVQQAGVITTTSSMQGVFSDHERTAKAEFMSIVKESW